MVTVPSGSRLRGIRYRTARSSQRYTIASRTKAIVNIRSFIGSRTMISKFVVRSQIVGEGGDANKRLKRDGGWGSETCHSEPSEESAVPRRLSKDKIPRCARNDKL